jgi:hypothetical protein
MIAYEPQYRDWLERQGVGSRDRVADTRASYVSFLRSVARESGKTISPATVRSEADIERLLEGIIGKADGSIRNYRSALNQYLAMVRAGLNGSGEASPPRGSFDESATRKTSNRTLTADELERARELLDRIRAELVHLSGSDPELLFAFRRKIYKELTYDERSKPMARRKLKLTKRQEQNGLCPICETELDEKYNVLDRFNAAKGYTVENTRLIHSRCDVETQAERGYS